MCFPEAKYFKTQSNDLHGEVKALESKVTLAIECAEKDKSQALVAVSTDNQALQQQVDRLARALELQNHDMRKLRRAANKVLNQRSDVEKFLVTALDQVRQEIVQNRHSYGRDGFLRVVHCIFKNIFFARI